MKAKRCQQCNKTEMHFEGCSHVECPERKTVSAAPPDEQGERWYCGGGVWGNGYRKEPTNHE